MIQVNFSIQDIQIYQSGELPTEAIKIETPKDMDEMIKKASPIAMVLCLFLFIIMFMKTMYYKTVVISPIFILFGFFVGFLLLIVHEWLHGIVYPKDALVTIGKLRGKLTFVALASYPLSRKRFIIMSLLPFLLGILPLFLFILSPAEFKALNGFTFGMACMGMVSPFPDVYNVFLVLKKADKKDRILFYKDDMYKIK